MKNIIAQTQNFSKNLGRIMLSIQKKYLELVLNIIQELIQTVSKLFKLNYTEFDYLNEANKLTQEGQFKKAIKNFNKAIKISPQWGAAYFYRGNTWQCLGNYKNSIEDYQQAIKCGWNDADLCFNLGNALIQTNEIEEAINSYKQATQLRNDFLEAYIKCGELFEQKKYLKDALEYYKKVLQIAPDYANIKQNIIKIFLAFDRIDVENTTDYLGFYPNPTLVKDIIDNSPQLDRIIMLSELALKNESETPDYYFLLGFVNEFNKNYQIAVENYQKALNLHPKDSQIKARFFDILTTKENLIFSQENLSKTFESEDELLSIANVVLNKSQDYEKAINLYQKIISVNVNCIEAYLQLGIIFEGFGDLTQAANNYQKILDIQPEHQEARHRLNKILIAQGKIEEVIQTEPFLIQLLSRLLTWFHLQILVVGAERIGHLACDPDAYLKEGLLKLRSPRFTVMLVPQKIANRHLLNYWKKYLIVIESNLLHYWFRNGLSTKIPHLNAARYSGVMYNAARYQNFQNQYKDRPPLLHLTEIDRQRGWDCLNQLGIPSDAWFVCIHCREPGYILDSVHDYRDADIKNYLGAVEAIVERGGWCIRMGDPTMSKLPKIERVIDYAHLDIKSEWMDIFLCATCQFFLGSSSGLAWVATVFGKPSVCANQAPLSVVLPYTPGDLGIPKLYWSKKQSRYLTFQEILDSPIGHFRYGNLYEKAEIEVQENSVDEIRDLAIEMLDRVEGKTVYTQEDNHLQNKFKSLLKPEHYCYGAESRIGRDFLRKHSDLLPNEE